MVIFFCEKIDAREDYGMKKKWMLLLTVTVMAGLFSGCTVDTKNSDNSSEDTEIAASITDGANDEYDFAMEIGGQEI